MVSLETAPCGAREVADRIVAITDRPQYGIYAGQDEAGERRRYCQHLRTEQVQQQLRLWDGGREVVGLA